MPVLTGDSLTKVNNAIMKRIVPLCAALALLAAGCGKGEARREIAAVRDAGPQDVRVPVGMSTKDRLGLGGMQGQVMASQGGASNYAWTAPEGWEELAPSPMRLANFRVAGDENTECYFTVLGGDGGGLKANIDRWLKQMGQEPMSEETVAALPKKPLLGKDALFVEIDGAYGGMGGENPQSDYKMLGAILIEGGQAFFVKMTGPASVVEGEKERFDTFCATLHDHASHGEGAHDQGDTGQAPAQDGMPAGHPPIGGDTAAAGQALSQDGMPAGHPPIDGNTAIAGQPSSSGLTWTAPSHWQQSGDRPMRDVTYTVGDGAVECYVATLGGPAGGVEANLNRWQSQMGQPPLSPADIAALPKITIFDQETALLQVKGNFTGMGGETLTDQMLLGVVAPLGGKTIFVKMTGPEAVVSPEVDDFVSFCESLK